MCKSKQAAKMGRQLGQEMEEIQPFKCDEMEGPSPESPILARL